MAPNREGIQPGSYSTINLPSREVVRALAGERIPQLIATMDSLFENVAREVNEGSRHAPDQSDFLARVRRGWLKWVPRFSSFAYASLAEPLLDDYRSERMAGLTTGLLCEGANLGIYLLGAVSDHESLHLRKELWRPFIQASLESLDLTHRALRGIEAWMEKRHRPSFRQQVDVTMKENLQNAKQYLHSMRTYLQELLDRQIFDGVEVKMAMVERTDVEACATLAVQCSKFLDEQGVINISPLSVGSYRAEEVIALDGDTILALTLCKTKINTQRDGLDRTHITDIREVIHDVARLFLASDIPYHASPWRDGLAATTGRRSHLELDLARISQETGYKPQTLRQHIEHRQPLQPAAARSLAQVVEASCRVRCFYRYYVVAIVPTGVQHHDKSYRLEVTSQDDPPPRDSLDAEALKLLLAEHPGPRPGPGRPPKEKSKAPAPKKAKAKTAKAPKVVEAPKKRKAKKPLRKKAVRQKAVPVEREAAPTAKGAAAAKPKVRRVRKGTAAKPGQTAPKVKVVARKKASSKSVAISKDEDQKPAKGRKKTNTSSRRLKQ